MDGGLTSCKYDKQPNYDQGVYASNHQPETNSGQDALRLEPDVLAGHCVSDAIARPITSLGSRGFVPGQMYKSELKKATRERVYLGGCSSPLNQPVARSVFRGSRWSQYRHRNLGCPLPSGGGARIKKAPQWGQVGRSA
jgi:hypothetical protein